MSTYRKIITMSLYNRPDYTARVLEGLAQCRGIEDYTVFFHCEPGFDNVKYMADQWPYAKEVFTNVYRLGCNQNILGALNHGFRESNYVVMVEDDCLPAPDFLQFMEYCRTKYMDDKQVFTCCGYRKAASNGEDLHRVHLEKWFTPWGWSTWEDRFDEMRRGWGIGTYDSWDLVVGKMRGERSQAVPIMGRIQNIGATLGQHVPSAQWHRDNQFNEFWAGHKDIVSMTSSGSFTDA